MYVDSEDLLGKWFARNPEKRQHVFLATKFGNKVLPDGSRAVDSSPEYCKAACEKSLKRLGLPFVDLYCAFVRPIFPHTLMQLFHEHGGIAQTDPAQTATASTAKPPSSTPCTPWPT